MVYGEEQCNGSILSSSHREADYRIVVHVLDGISKGFTRISVRENDTYIVVILMAYMRIFLQAYPTIKISLIHFGISNCRMLLFLHVFSGYDYTPSFFGIGKNKFFDEMVKNIGRLLPLSN